MPEQRSNNATAPNLQFYAHLVIYLNLWQAAHIADETLPQDKYNQIPFWMAIVI